MIQENLLPFSRRLREIRDALGVSQKDFAKSLMISGSYLSEIENGKVKANFDFFQNLSRQYRVNLKYLLNGEGEMFSEHSLHEETSFRELGELGAKLEEMVRYMIRSPFVMVSMISYFTIFFYKNEEIIKKDIEDNRGIRGALKKSR